MIFVLPELSNSFALFNAFSSSRYIQAFTSFSFSLIRSKQLDTHSNTDRFLFLNNLTASVAVSSYGFVIKIYSLI